MNIEEYYQTEESKLSFTRQQASDFAKKVAGDFNPIHDIDSKRFCVPGDLLFSVIIHHYGLQQNMVFNFSGMVSDNVDLILPDGERNHLALMDEKEKKYLAIERKGETTTNAKLIESLTTHYVEFSSQAFPHIIVPLMSEHNVMINPDRPLIIYESMSFELDTLDIDNIELELSSNKLMVNGKRGSLTLDYNLLSNGSKVGSGCKRMVLSGLREFDRIRMDEVTEAYNHRKMQFA
ncbi:MAG: DUF3581 domain-containing protein [Gammaproteobacteria bacterium]|nr:DUF3581 domain-containing protein [Gammaproteobacteria bacterium]